ncbi:MAG: twin-arginine translocase subunit TatC [Polyangiaceae bacterium]
MSEATAKKDEPEDGEEAGPEDDKPMTFWEHLEELRKRIVYSLVAVTAGCLVAWYYKEKLLYFLTKPLKDAWESNHLAGNPDLNFSSPEGSFLAYFNLSLIGGLGLAAPVVFYQLWSFVAPGLYAKEKRYVIPFVMFSSILFVGGGYFGFLAAFPFTFGYFLSLAGDIGGVTVKPTLMMDDYISFTLKTLLGFGIVFQIPILMMFLARIGLVTHIKLFRWARYYIFIAFLVAAILTPPDWASQLVMAFPACGLYFMSIGLVYIFQRPEALAAERELQREKAAAEAEEKAEREARAKAERDRERERERLRRERQKLLAAKAAEAKPEATKPEAEKSKADAPEAGKSDKQS